MIADFNVRGVRMVRRKLTNYLRDSEIKTSLGVWEAGLVLQRASQKRTPVVTGNLKGSAYTEAWKSGIGPAVEVGYMAVYAHLVHEAPNAGKLGHLNPPEGPQIYSNVGENKFLEKAVNAKRLQMLEIIKKRAGVK